MSIFNKKNIAPLAVLVSICLVVAVLMGVINMLTEPRIKDYEEQKVYDSLREVLDGTFKPLDIPEGAPETVTGLYKVTDSDGSFKGNVVTVEKQGYASKIALTVGIDKDGKTTKVVITAEQETHGKNISSLVDSLSAGIGADDVAGVDTISGATKTSNYIKDAVKDAFLAIGVESEEPEDKPDDNEGAGDNGGNTETDSIKDSAAALVGEGADLVKIDFEQSGDTKAIYKDEGGLGYVAHIVVMSTNYEGQVETETLLWVGEDLAVKGIEKLQWNVSPAAPDWGYNPPSDDVVDAFYAGLVGKDETSLGELDLATGATNTTSNLVNSLISAISDIEKAIASELPTSFAGIKEIAGELVGGEVELSPVEIDDCQTLKRLYKLDGGEGYIAYIVVMSTHYEGQVETETLLWVGDDLDVKGIKKLQWNVSAAAPDWGYNPPSTEDVDAFYAGLVGKDHGSINDVDLTTGATNTTTAMVNSLVEAIAEIDEVISADIPTKESEIRDLAAELVGSDVSAVDFESADYLKRLYKAKGGEGYIAYIVVMSTHYEGQVETETLLWVGSDLTVKGIKKLQWNVSAAAPDWGYNPPSTEDVDAFYAGLVGKDETSLGELDLATGATNTTTALVNSLIEAINVIDAVASSDLPTPESEIRELANELVGTEVSLVSKSFENAKYLKRLYKIESGEGYIAYTVVMSTHYEGQVETETLLWIGNDLTVKGIKKLQWNVSAAAPDWGYNPPSEDEVDAFYASLVGKHLNDLGDVDLATGATNTTTAFIISVTDAINRVDEAIALESADSGKPTVKELAEELVGEGSVLVKLDYDGAKYTKIIYKVEGGLGYVAYIVVMSSHYEGQVETETLVWVGEDLSVKGIKKLQWNVSEANPEWGYNPPSEDEVDAFYAGLVGKNEATLGDVDLSTGATNTTTAMVDSVIEAIGEIDSIIGGADGEAEAVDYTARIIGIAILAAMVLGFVGYGIYTYLKRRKTDE